MRRVLLSLFFAVAAIVVGMPPASAVTGGGVVSVLECLPGPVKQVDPILFPNGEASDHMHQFFGGSAIAEVGTPTDPDAMRASDSTCPLNADTAGYWVPVLYDATGMPVAPRSMNAYYRSPKGVEVRVPEANSGLICGIDMARPECDTAAAQNGGGWGCSDSEAYTTIAEALPCSKVLIAHVQMKPIDRTLPKVTLHVRYPITSGEGYYLASDHGAPGGSTLHGDVWFTWDIDSLQNVIDTLNAGKSCKGMTDSTASCLV